MYVEHEAMMVVRAELCERLDRLRATARRSRGRDFAEGLDGLKRLAGAYGLTPVIRVADALGRAVAEDGPARAPLYFARLQDAIGCERLDEAASEAMLASVSVRLA